MPGAATLAVAAAMVGIVAGGVIGGPIGTYLVERKLRVGPRGRDPPGSTTLANVAEEQLPSPARPRGAGGEDVEAYVLMKHLVLLLVTVGVGIGSAAG